MGPGPTAGTDRSRGGSASSLYRPSVDDAEYVHVRDVEAVLDELGYEDVKLLKLDAEGAEFEILERLIEVDYLDRFENVQISFHHVVDEPVRKREAIRDHLAEPHELNYDHPFVMEEWTRTAEVSARVAAGGVDASASTVD